MERNVSSQDHSASRLNSNSSFELGYYFSWLLNEDWVGCQQVMFGAFNHSYLSHCGILKCSDGKWECWEPLVDFSEECSGTLDLEVVLSIKFSLVDCDSEL